MPNITEKHRSKHQWGEKNASWKGGRYVNHEGYRRIRVPKDHPMRGSNGYCFEHRLVMADFLGRALRPFPFEQVHHMNGDKQDNRIENLRLTISHHGNGSEFKCMDCGSKRIESI